MKSDPIEGREWRKFSNLKKNRFDKLNYLNNGSTNFSHILTIKIRNILTLKKLLIIYGVYVPFQIYRIAKKLNIRCVFIIFFIIKFLQMMNLQCFRAFQNKHVTWRNNMRHPVSIFLFYVHRWYWIENYVLQTTFCLSNIVIKLKGLLFSNSYSFVYTY